MRLVKTALLLALSFTLIAPVATSIRVQAADPAQAMEAKKAQAQEVTGKAKLPKKGAVKTVKESNAKVHCEKCHEKGEAECKACQEVAKTDAKDAKKAAKADCKDCPDCKSGKKNCETCEHCHGKKHEHNHAADAGKDAAKADATKTQ